MATLKKWKWILVLVAGLLLGLSVGVYLGLSRRGYVEADQFNMKGFYYFLPEESDAWRSREGICEILFAPLNGIDRLIGCGRDHAFEPLWHLGPKRK
ncbi:MAG TPA: hypothetical protein PLN21_04590 [Gemmatales bacterium]|nr:hypothetical protein [Gemmatales bacterium]